MKLSAKTLNTALRALRSIGSIHSDYVDVVKGEVRRGQATEEKLQQAQADYDADISAIEEIRKALGDNSF